MAEKHIRSNVLITATDKTDAAFRSVSSRIDRLASQGRKVDALGRDFARVGRSVDDAGKTMDRLHRKVRDLDTAGARLGRTLRTVASGVAAVATAHRMLEVGREAIRAGVGLQHERVALTNAGRTPAEMREIQKAATVAALKVPTATYEEGLKTINETTGAFGSLHHAIENLNFVLKTSAVLHAAAGDKIQDDAGAMGGKLARFFEMRGTAGDSHKFQHEAEELVRAMVFTRGNFNPSEALLFAQQAKGALMNYDLRFLTRIAPSLITEQGGDRAGTSLNALNSVIMGKARDKKQTAEWLRYGLLDPKQVVGNASSPIGWRAGAVKGTDLFLKDPLAWMETIVLPALQKKGIDINDNVALAKVFGTMFRNQNSNFGAMLLGQAQSRARLHKDEALIGQVKGIDDAFENNLEKDPSAAFGAFNAQFENLLSTVTGPMMEPAAAALTSIAEGLGRLADAAKDHPMLAMAGGATAAAAGGVATIAAGHYALRGIGASLGLGGEAAGGVGGSALPWMARGLGAFGTGGMVGYLGGQAAVGLGGIAAGKYWTPKTVEDLSALNAELAELDQRINQIRARSRTPEGAAMEAAPLEAKAADIRNRINSVRVEGEASVTNELKLELTVTPNSLFDMYVDKRIAMKAAQVLLRQTNAAGSTGLSMPEVNNFRGDN